MKEMSKKQVNYHLAACVNWLNILPLKESGLNDAARMIGKSPRTVEAYLSNSNERTISAKDLMTIATEVARRVGKFPKTLTPVWVVYDQSGEIIENANNVATASFLADLECGSYSLDRFAFDPLPNLPSGHDTKSTLRRLISSGAVSTEYACEVLECDEYTLVAYQCIFPFSEMPDAADVFDLAETSSCAQQNWKAA